MMSIAAPPMIVIFVPVLADDAWMSADLDSSANFLARDTAISAPSFALFLINSTSKNV